MSHRAGNECNLFKMMRINRDNTDTLWTEYASKVASRCNASKFIHRISTSTRLYLTVQTALTVFCHRDWTFIPFTK